LEKEDEKEIHCYFMSHRQNNKLISHLRIQRSLIVGLAIIVLIYHLSRRVIPGLNAPWSNFEMERAIPYIITVLSIYYLFKFAKGEMKRYEEFLEKSPGKEIGNSNNKSWIGHAQK
jgi:hypothetical protein